MARRTRGTTLASDADLRAAYAAHGAELYRFALRSLGDTGLAEEAVQDTFVRAWRAADRHDRRRGPVRGAPPGETSEDCGKEQGREAEPERPPRAR